MSANFPLRGPVKQLDRRAEPEEQITEDQATEPPRVARLLMSLLRDVATLKRRWWPRRLDFEDRAVDSTGTTLYRFEHRLGGRVRWWVVDWQSSVGSPWLNRDATTSNDVLVLVSLVSGTATIRIEEAGA